MFRSSLLIVPTLGVLLAFTSFPAMAQVKSLCDRTLEVRIAIATKLRLMGSEVSSCAEVTEVHLAEIDGLLDLRGPHLGDWATIVGLPEPLTELKPGDFSGLTSLQYLSLSHNDLTSLPEGIFSGLSSLESLYLADNDLSNLPEEIFSGLPSLETLDLALGDSPSYIPVNLFFGLASLRRLELELGDNYPSSLVSELFFGSGLTSLETLILSYSKFNRLPEGGIFSNLKSLKQLQLSGGSVSLPEKIFDGATSLEVLILSRNKLTDVPEGLFSGLISLRVLSLSFNQLDRLPSGLFSGLPSLQEIYLHNNALPGLPEGIFSGLTSLSALWLDGNPREDIYRSHNIPLAVDVSLNRVGESQFQAKAHTGAPFEIVLPVDVANGTVVDGRSHLTIPAGSIESIPLKVSRNPGTTSAVTVDIIRLPEVVLPGHNGYTLVKASTPLTVLGAHSLDFPHFANGESIISELVLVNTDSVPIHPAVSFFDKGGGLISPSSVVDVGNELRLQADGTLTVRTALPSLGELTISTHGRGPLVTGSVRVISDGPIGGVLRFNSPDIGVAGVGASPSLQDAVFPVRRQESGVNTGAAIQNPGADPVTVNCQLMRGGTVLDEAMIPLPSNGQTARFIDEMFIETDTSDFVGSVRCSATEDEMFAAVALEMDFQNHNFTTLPVVPVPQLRTSDYTQLYFAHFTNGSSIVSDLVFVNVASEPIRPAIYFYDRGGTLIVPASVVDMAEGFQVRSDGALTIQSAVAPLGELTISTHGRGELMTGSVRVIADGPLGGFLRYDSPEFGVAGVGVSESGNDVLFPARRDKSGINTGAAIRNAGDDPIEVHCQLMKSGSALEETRIPLEVNGQTARFIHEMFTKTTSGFVGSVRCTASDDGRFTGVALEMDAGNRIFTTLPVVRFYDDPSRIADQIGLGPLPSVCSSAARMDQEEEDDCIRENTPNPSIGIDVERVGTAYWRYSE